MESSNLIKQMIGFQKTFLENSHNSMVVMQNHSKNIINGFLDQFPWVTEEVKTPLHTSFSFIEKVGDDYKNSVDQGFDILEGFVTSKQDPPQKQTASQQPQPQKATQKDSGSTKKVTPKTRNPTHSNSNKKIDNSSNSATNIASKAVASPTSKTLQELKPNTNTTLDKPKKNI